MLNWKAIRFRSIKMKLILMFSIAGSIPMLGSMMLINHRTRISVIESAEQRLVDAAEEVDQRLQAHYDTLAIDAEYIAKLDSIRCFTQQENESGYVDDAVLLASGREIAFFQKLHMNVAHSIFVTDLKGNVVLDAPVNGWGVEEQTDADAMRRTQGKDFRISLADLPDFKKALKGTIVTDSRGYSDDDHGHQLVMTPVLGLDDQVSGVVVIEVAFDYIDREILSAFRFGETGRLYLSSIEGHRIVHYREDYRKAHEVGEGISQAADTGELAKGWFRDTGGKTVYGAYIPVKRCPWVICAEVDRAEIMAPLAAHSRHFAEMMGLSVLALAAAVVAIGRLFWKPLETVVEATGRVADGDLWHPIEVTRKDELGQLQGAVEHMRVSMKQQIDHLDAQVAERTSELEYAYEKLRLDSETDKLTGLANREVLLNRLGHELNCFKRDPSHLVSVLFFDFDRFKVVNDSLGHATGDALLCSIADRFRSELREVDLAARFGGDEFVVMLGPVKSQEQALQGADRLLKLFEEAHIIDGHRIISTASIGLVIADPRYSSAAEMIRDADAAMYEAKLAGKGQVVVFDRVMLENAHRRLRLEEDLAQAIERGQLLTVYQPIIGLDDMKLKGFESLVRWNHHELGLVRPDDFIPIAEDTGQIVEVGQWVLRQSVEQLCRWDRELGLDGTLSMNVNVAKRQLIHPGFLDEVRSVLDKSGIEPHRLKVEITESTAIDPRHDMSVVINQIRDMGVQIAMDDFGTGYSSLSLLHKFHLDVLKIDKSFIQGMEHSRELSAVLHSIISMAQNTGMRVVAEGVETPSQIACLISHGCDMVQGYYFAKPLSTEEAAEFIGRPVELRKAS